MSHKKSSPLFTFDPRYKENLFGSGGTPEGEAPPARVLMEPREYLPTVPLGKPESSEPVSFGSEPGVFPDLPLRHTGVVHELKKKTAKKATTGGRRRGQKTHRRKGKKPRRKTKKSRRGAKKSRRH